MKCGKGREGHSQIRPPNRRRDSEQSPLNRPVGRKTEKAKKANQHLTYWKKA